MGGGGNLLVGDGDDGGGAVHVEGIGDGDALHVPGDVRMAHGSWLNVLGLKN